MAEHARAMKALQEKARLRREAKREQEAQALASANEEANRAQRLIEEARKRREEWVGVVLAVHDNNEAIAVAKLAKIKDTKAALSAKVGDGGATLLHLAVSRGFQELMRAVLKLEPQAVRACDEEGQTPLHRVAMVDAEGDLIDLLAEYATSADFDAQDSKERTPLDIAEQWGFGDTLDILREVRHRLTPATEAAVQAEAEQPDFVPKFPGFGDLAGITAVSEGRFDDALNLIKEPMWVFVNSVDRRKKTLLHHAAIQGREDVCEALLARHDFKSADAFDSDMATALHLAVVNSRTECVRVIIGCDKFHAVNAEDLRRTTALQHAAARENEEIFKLVAGHPLCISSGSEGFEQQPADIDL